MPSLVSIAPARSLNQVVGDILNWPAIEMVQVGGKVPGLAQTDTINVQQPTTDGMGNNLGSLCVDAWTFGYNGATFDRIRVANITKTIPATAAVAGTGFSAWIPAAGNKWRVLGFAVSLSVAGSVIFKDGATEVFRTPLMAAGVGLSILFPTNGVLSAVANNQLNIDVTANGNVSGFIIGCEN